MEFRVLGPLEVRRESTVVSFPGEKTNTVLAVLLLANRRTVTDGSMGALLWGGNPPGTARAQIYSYVSQLRKQLGPETLILRSQAGYRLQTAGLALDAVTFDTLARQGHEALREGRFEYASARLREALDLWRGPALANTTEFLREVEAPRLEEARLLALENRIQSDLALGEHEQTLPELTRLVAEHPMRERMRAQLMTALFRCGRQADALLTYHQGRRVLAEQLGVDPGEPLRSTYQAILAGESEPPRGPSSRAAAVPLHPVPVPVPRAGHTDPGSRQADQPGDMLIRLLRTAAGSASAPSPGSRMDAEELVRRCRSHALGRRLLNALDEVAAGQSELLATA
ncbi:BTAD domain-containing putative transcriptional regulator [Streptomyces sp. NPDC092296]|uniref:AfsR/SARP family transcriptional regulator n=1 Tax=Streptomyces sp. NPDC092296 TaxID=3366012 RepID=UPI00381F61D2